MTVAELIQKLQRCPQDLPVVTDDADGDITYDVRVRSTKESAGFVVWISSYGIPGRDL